MDQNKLRKNIKLARIEDNDFQYQDLAEMLQIKNSSFYNWLNGSYNLSQKKARYLSSWLSDKGYFEEITEK